MGVRTWLAWLEVRTLFIEPGSPWETGYCEAFNGKLRDERLDREIFSTLQEARILIEGWRLHYNARRPHSALGYRPPAPEARASSRLALPKPSEVESMLLGARLGVDQSVGAGEATSGAPCRSTRWARRGGPRGGRSPEAVGSCRPRGTQAGSAIS